MRRRRSFRRKSRRFSPTRGRRRRVNSLRIGYRM